MSNFEYYLGRGYRLTPIKPGTKRPIPKKWTVNTITTRSQIEQYPGHSLGWVLDADHLVIDVDPRNGGREGLRLLSEKFKTSTGQKITEVYPVISTPSGGVHIYTTKPADCKTVKKSDLYGPGVDFLSVGAQCLTDGSSHPDGGVYQFISPDHRERDPQPAPEWLLRELSVPVDSPTVVSNSTERAFTRSQISGMLSQLDVTEFRDHADWLQIMQSVHESSRGEDLDLFLDWSLSDPLYSGDRDVIAQRWQSHKSGKSGNVQPGTLVAMVTNRGGVLPPSTIEEAAEQIPQLPTNIPDTVGEILHDGRDRQRCPVSYIEEQISKTTDWSGKSTLAPIIKMLLPHPWAERRRLIKKLAKASGYSVADVRDFLLTEAGDEHQTSDPAVEVAELVLREYFDSEDRVTHATDQRFWVYRKTHWSPMAKNIIAQYLMQASEKWKARHPEKSIATTTLMYQAERILLARVASEIDFHGVTPPNNIINVLNGELHLDYETGSFELVPHDPANFQTSCLGIKWDPKAKCKRFEKFLKEVFSNSPNPDEIIRHLWELIGYTIQGRKDIASWILLTGEGSNGKTTLLKTLTALLGKHVCNASIADIASSVQGLDDLVGKMAMIDEDLSSRYRLPDSFLKKVSENKMLRANPKYEAAFNFENRAIVWMATNVLPACDDISHGMLRRAHVLHFGRIFTEDEQDKTLDHTFATKELPGIFVKALQGLKRLRRRGKWELPGEIKFRIKGWATAASPLALWHHSIVKKVPKHKNEYVLLRDMYNHYRLWCEDQGLSYSHSKPVFRKKLESAGVCFDRVGANRIVARDVALVDEDQGPIKDL